MPKCPVGWVQIVQYITDSHCAWQIFLSSILHIFLKHFADLISLVANPIWIEPASESFYRQ